MLARLLAPVLGSVLSMASSGCLNAPPAQIAPHARQATNEGEPTPEPAPVIVEVDPPAPAPVDADLPDCPSETEPSLPVYCTEAGKLAGAWTMADMVKIPSDAAILFDAEADNADRSSLVVAQLGETLYLRHRTCSSCRRVLGHGFSGRLSAMTEAQLIALQAGLGLPAEVPALTSLAAWASYCADAKGRAILTDIAHRDRAHTPDPLAD